MKSTLYVSIGHCALCYLGPSRVSEKIFIQKKFKKFGYNSLKLTIDMAVYRTDC